MQFTEPLIPAILLRRYKRFLADVELADGQQITVHCPNTGAMTGCAEPGWTVWLSRSESKTRKYPHTWELVDTGSGMACVHSVLANKVVAEAFTAGAIPGFETYTELQREVRYGEGSRADLMLRDGPSCCMIEVKSVTLRLDGGRGIFPDAVSKRASKHLRELQQVVVDGQRALMFFCVLHEGIDSVSPAAEIDPEYARTYAEAVASGVEVAAWRASVSPQGLVLNKPLPII